MKNQRIYLEHANLTVNDLNSSIEFFKTAFPHFDIRGGDENLNEWVHLGDDQTYLALNQAAVVDGTFDKNYDKIGINHIGFVVDDVKEIADRLIEKGYKRDYPIQIQKFRIRDYFADSDGNQYEFVQYLSDKIEERNSYDD